MTTDGRHWNATASGAAGGPEATLRPSGIQVAGPMERYLFFGRVLEALGQGAVFRSWFSRIIRILAAGTALAGIVVLFRAWQFTSRQQASGIIGGMVFMLFLAAGIYMVVHAAFIRAGHIASLPDGEFTVIPVSAVFSLLAGESYAAFCASVSLGGGILIWFIRGDAFTLLREVSAFVPAFGGTDFLAGILFMIRGLFRAALALAGGYLASELLLVFGRMGEKNPGGSASKE